MRAFKKIAACALVVVGLAVVWLFTGIGREPEAIRASLLREQPVGTPMAEIERWLTKDKRLRY